jgi:hypothetical protein
MDEPPSSPRVRESRTLRRMAVATLREARGVCGATLGFLKAASHWPRTRARGILLPPQSTQEEEGERHEHEQAGAPPTDPRMGSIGATLRVA